jgi:PadR family transcriptional regulator AphA
MTSMEVTSLTIEHALLGFLSERPMHGYDIYQQISQPNGLGLVWRIKRSQLYALLARLEGQGYIAASVEIHDRSRPRRFRGLADKSGEPAARIEIGLPGQAVFRAP